MSNEASVNELKQIQNALLTIQQISVKAFQAQNLQNLIFIILNDTYQVLNYDRAILFSFKPGNVKILGVSGQANFNGQTELSSRLVLEVESIKEKDVQKIFPSSDNSSTIFWAPFHAGDQELGLWLERYDTEAEVMFENYAPLFKEMLLPAFAAAWKKINQYSLWGKIVPYITLKKTGFLALILSVLLLIIPVHLRIVVPCEVTSKESFVVAAPLDGIIEKIDVKSGQDVKKGQELYGYDKKIFTYKYNTLLKEVEILQAERSQAYTLGLENASEASKLGMLDIKLKKSKVDLAYAEHQLSLLTGKSPINGLVSMDNPDDWSGKPVKMGDKIMTIGSNGQTKLKMWIPEKDNILFAKDIPIRVFLNTIPTKSFEAELLFISPVVKVSEGELPGFEAEATWVNLEEPPKLGLKGSAVIYGEKVSLFYYFLRKPIGAARKFFGI